MGLLDRLFDKGGKGDEAPKEPSDRGAASTIVAADKGEKPTLLPGDPAADPRRAGRVGQRRGLGDLRPS